MLNAIHDKANRFRQRLTSLDNQPIGKAALLVIIFLDLFILSAIFDGLADHTRQLPSPDQQIPQLCRDIVIDADWNPSNRLDNLARLVSSYNALRFTPDQRPDHTQQHPICAPIVGAYNAIRDDTGLARDFREMVNLTRETQTLRADMERMKGAYDTQLLETIAKQPQPATDTAAIRKTMADRTASLNELVRQQGLLDASLAEDPRVRQLFDTVAKVTDADRTTLRDELRQLNFWYPAKRLGMEMLFLLPLLAVFYFWNSRSIAGRRPFQTLVSSHLLVVAVIPVFLKVMNLVYDIIPRKLLRHLIELLESLKLVAIWHYLVIAVAIGAALALIYLFQKKLFSREKLMQRRIAKGLCQECGVHLPPDSRHCPACGAAQFRVCSHCNGLTHLHGQYCRACGQAVV
jgi:ribosomal protein L40E